MNELKSSEIKSPPEVPSHESVTEVEPPCIDGAAWKHWTSCAHHESCGTCRNVRARLDYLRVLSGQAPSLKANPPKPEWRIALERMNRGHTKRVENVLLEGIHPRRR